MVRKQPMQTLPAASSSHTPMQGDGTPVASATSPTPTRLSMRCVTRWLNVILF
jgi:hypothetical protein